MGVIVSPTEVTAIHSPYGPRGDGYHYGIDLGALYGDPIVCPFPGPGLVVMAEDVGGGTGLCTNINHPDVNKQTRYFHQSGFAIVAGDVVELGQTIGWVGTSGGVAQHLHYEVLDLGTFAYEDPAPYVVAWSAPGVPVDVEEEREEAEMPSYACSMLRDPDSGAIYVQNGLRRRYLPNQDAINTITGTGLCNPLVQDLPFVYIESIPWDPADPYNPATTGKAAPATAVARAPRRDEPVDRDR
jgi:murein DD-endopeptidase MepM/ murein hydrolase activator NlpD